MADDSSDASRSRDLWRITLCLHGFEHARQDPECRLAHSLSELRRPVEMRVGYRDQWSGYNVDRFYGQRMSRDQLDRFWHYYNHTPACERPQWATGLHALEMGEECSLAIEFPWDFGLVGDYERLFEDRARLGLRRPFRFYPHIWERLHRRRSALLDLSGHACIEGSRKPM